MLQYLGNYNDLLNLPIIDDTIGGVKNSKNLINSGAVNGIEIGGVNLILKTSESYKSVEGTNSLIASFKSEDIIKSNIKSNNSMVCRVYIDNTENTNDCKLRVYGIIDGVGKTITYGDTIIGKNEGYSTAYFDFPNNCTEIRMYLYSSISSIKYYKCLKLEKGNKYTDWSPSPNDINITKSDIGLGNVDNTSDNQKSVLSATKLSKAITINGVSFDGSQNINIPLATWKDLS